MSLVFGYMRPNLCEVPDFIQKPVGTKKIHSNIIASGLGDLSFFPAGIRRGTLVLWFPFILSIPTGNLQKWPKNDSFGEKSWRHDGFWFWKRLCHQRIATKYHVCNFCTKILRIECARSEKAQKKIKKSTKSQDRMCHYNFPGHARRTFPHL